MACDATATCHLPSLQVTSAFVAISSVKARDRSWCGLAQVLASQVALVWTGHCLVLAGLTLSLSWVPRKAHGGGHKGSLPGSRIYHPVQLNLRSPARHWVPQGLSLAVSPGRTA
jgi:hypothetical protein